MGSAVAEVLGQLKWSWFRRPRSLFDIQLLDKARDSLFGSLQLLTGVGLTVIGTLAALVTILSLAIGPFTQQAIKTVTCQSRQPSANASVPVANLVQLPFLRVGSGIYDVLFGLKGVMVSGMTNPRGNDSTVSATCPTGNCTWPVYNNIAYSTTAMCSKCLDSSAELPKPGPNANYSLSPGGLSISKSGVNPLLAVGGGLAWTSSPFARELSDTFSSSILNLTVLAFTKVPCSESPQFQTCADDIDISTTWARMRPIAVSCVLYACVQGFQGEVWDGLFNETLVSSTLMRPGNDAGQADGAGLLTNFTYDPEPVRRRRPAVRHDQLLYGPEQACFQAITINGADVTAPPRVYLYVRGQVIPRLQPFPLRNPPQGKERVQCDTCHVHRRPV